MNPFKSNNMIERAKFMRNSSPELVQAAFKMAGLSSPIELQRPLTRCPERCSYCGRGDKRLGSCEGCGAP